MPQTLLYKKKKERAKAYHKGNEKSLCTIETPPLHDGVPMLTCLYDVSKFVMSSYSLPQSYPWQLKSVKCLHHF